jgi:hypothetical protein
MGAKMEAVVQILEAEELVPVMYIPSEMRHSRLEVTIRPYKEPAANESQTVAINHPHHEWWGMLFR